jgi:hypothetical protein
MQSSSNNDIIKESYFNGLVDRLSLCEYDIQPHLNTGQFIYPNYSIFSVSDHNRSGFFHDYYVHRDIYNEGVDISFLGDLFEISKKFKFSTNKQERINLNEQFKVLQNNIDLVKWKQMVDTIHGYGLIDPTRMERDINRTVYLLDYVNLPSYDLVCFHGSLYYEFDFSNYELDVDLYDTFFSKYGHAFAMFYYSPTNTFYIIDPDQSIVDNICKKYLKKIAKRLSFQPKIRQVLGDTIQTILQDNLCAVHSLDYFKKISQNPKILEENDEEICEYLLKDYLDSNGDVDQDKVYQYYANHYI